MSSLLITNANAPVVDINIKIDFRYTPENIQLNASQSVPGILVVKTLLTCALNLTQMMIQEEAKRAQGKPPDLPPAPSN